LKRVDIAIVGGGAAAVAFAKELKAHPAYPGQICTIAPSQFGHSEAFSAPFSALTNTPVHNNSLSSRDPAEFFRFLTSRGWPYGRDDFTPRWLVNTVSHGSRHWLTDMYAERIDEVAGLPTVRHTDSVNHLGSEYRGVVEYVKRCLDALEIRDGAAHTEVRLTPRGPLLIEVNSRIMGPCLLPDPYMAAFGYSQQHILSEKILRPEEFEKRIDAKYSPQKSLVKVFLRSHKPGTLTAIPGFRVMRRLPHFHSVAWMPPVGEALRDLTLTTGYMGIAFFVGDNAESVMRSVDAVHDLEDRGLFFEVAEPTV
jgi:hypothetical protein